MSTNRNRIAGVVALAGLLLTLNQAMADETRHEGILVGIRGGQIAIVGRDRIATHVYPMTNFVKVTRNGQEASLGNLQRGDSVQIMTETRFRMEYVVAIEAIGNDDSD